MGIPGEIDVDAEKLLKAKGWEWNDWLRGFKPIGMVSDEIEEKRRSGIYVVVDFGRLKDMGLAEQFGVKPLSVDNPQIKRKSLKLLERLLDKIQRDLKGK